MTEIANAASTPSIGIEFDTTAFDLDAMLETSLTSLHEKEIVKGKVTQINKDFVTVDFGYKSEGQVQRQEFYDENAELNAKLGDVVEVYIERFEDEDGQVIVSREKAVKLRVWEDVGKIHDDDGIISGIITARIKGGLSVDIGIKAFLPGSQVDLRPVRNLDKLLGERFDFKVLKYNPKRGNIVLSRRAILELDRQEQRTHTLEQIKEGAVVKGHVKNNTDYGVFCDLGGVDGLLHITDMTWGRIVHPSEMFTVGDEIDVMVLKFDQESEKVSLGLKQKSANPWEKVRDKYPIGTQISGKVVSLTNYGAFVEVEEGIEGLIHVSEMSWTKKIRQPSSVLSLGEVITAVIKELDTEQRRISLSMKEATSNPWKEVADRYSIGSIVKGKIRNITDFGIFVGLDEGIDGLVHISDMSWSQRQRNPNEVYKKGEEVEVKILNVDVDTQRLSLGIKQLEVDPWSTLEEEIKEGDIITGKVVHIADFGVFLEAKPGVEGLVHISEIDKEVNKKSLLKFYPIGSELQAKVINLKQADRRLGLSIVGLIEKLDELRKASREDADTDEEEAKETQNKEATPQTDSESDQPAEAAAVAAPAEEQSADSAISVATEENASS